jgi:SAM-dependent methyltransferase
MTDPTDRPVDPSLLEYYADRFDEAARLTTRSVAGRLELVRTQELLRERLRAGSRVIDVGGGPGAHAVPLREAGHDVLLIDPVARHVDAAAARGVEARLGDARALDVASRSADAVLLLGPLYHLAERDDRLLALREAVRVLRPGGLLAAAAISRFAALGALMLGRPVPHPLPPSWRAQLEDGDIPPRSGGFPRGHAHTAEELEEELREAGVRDVVVHGLEGPAGLALESVAELEPRLFDAALDLARLAGTSPGERDLSNHLLAVGAAPA